MYIVLCLEHPELLLDADGSVDAGLVFQSVEAHCFAERPALADSEDVAFLHVREAGRDVDCHILVPLLKSARQSTVGQVKALLSASRHSVHDGNKMLASMKTSFQRA